MAKFLEDDRCLQLEDEIPVIFDKKSNEFDRSIFDSCDDDEPDSCESHDPAIRAEYWESQETMLQEILAHNSLLGSKLWPQINQALEMARETAPCRCPQPSSDRCARCLRQAVVNRLSDNGFNAALCTSKWKSTRKILGGTHEYIDVIVRGSDRKKETRLLIELEFQAEFEIAKACDEYRKLINQLPKSYVGKHDHLNAIVCVVCDAAKMSMKEQKIHLGPWRKRSFMQMKWSSSYQRWSTNQSSNGPVSSRRVHSEEFCLQFSPAMALKVS